MAILQQIGAAANSSTAVSSLAFASASPTAGRYTVVCVSLANTSAAVSSVTDTKGNTYAQRASINGSGIRAEIWSCVTATGGSGNVITINLSAASAIAAAYQEYSGVTALGNTGTGTGSGYLAASRAAVQDIGNWLVGAIAFACQSGDTLTVFEGVARQSSIPAAAAAGIGLIDNTSPGAGQPPVSERINNSRAWAVACLELRSGGATALQYRNYTGALPLHVPTLIAGGGGLLTAGGGSFTFIS